MKHKPNYSIKSCTKANADENRKPLVVLLPRIRLTLNKRTDKGL